MTLPNALSVTRALLAIPVAAGLSLDDPPYAALAGLFALAIASDVLDGVLARRLALDSALGSFLDALADKLLVFAVLAPVAARYPQLAPAVLILASRDAVVTAYRSELLRRGQRLEASRLARLKTSFLLGGCELYLLAGLARSFGAILVAEVLVVAGMAAALLSAFQYVLSPRPAHA